MKAMHFVVAICAILATASVAHANLVLVGGTPDMSFVDLGAQGFGNAPRLLTIQAIPASLTIESGSVAPDGADADSDPEVSGDAIAGANKSTTPTLTALEWTSGSEVGIGFNTTENNTGILLEQLTLTIYNGLAVAGSFSIAAPITFTAADLALQTGNGNGVFAFGLDAAQQVLFDAILAQAGSGNFLVGLSSTLGCQSGAADCSSDGGPETFTGFKLSAAVPDGGSMSMLLGMGLMGLAAVRRVIGRK